MRPLILMLLAAAAAVAIPPVAHAAYPGGNGKIAFTSNEGGGINDYRIWVMDPDGSNRVQLTHGPESDRAPAWSPDGTRIAFSRSVIGSGSSQVYVINADGTGLTQLTDAPRRNSGASWSPDGERLVFATSRFGGDQWQLWTMKVDGSDERLLIDTFGVDEFPAWSPDDGRIVFTGQSSGPWNLWTVRPDGSGLTNLTNTANRSYFAADWSPDSMRIAFDAGRIGLVNADGTGEHYVTGAGNFYPAWSPDGTRIAFAKGFGDKDIWVMSPDGSGQVPVAVLPQEQDQPDWQPIVNRPPDCSALAADPDTFERHDRRLRIVRVGGAVDPDGDPVEIEVTGVTQDEAVTGRGDHTRPDARLMSGDVVRIRAERSPRGDGRVYRIAVTATDPGGETCNGFATVSVSRHMHRPAVDSAPPSYNSVTGTALP